MQGIRQRNMRVHRTDSRHHQRQQEDDSRAQESIANAISTMKVAEHKTSVTFILQKKSAAKRRRWIGCFLLCLINFADNLPVGTVLDKCEHISELILTEFGFDANHRYVSGYAAI